MTVLLHGHETTNWPLQVKALAPPPMTWGDRKPLPQERFVIRTYHLKCSRKSTWLLPSSATTIHRSITPMFLSIHVWPSLACRTRLHQQRTNSWGIGITFSMHLCVTTVTGKSRPHLHCSILLFRFLLSLLRKMLRGDEFSSDIAAVAHCELQDGDSLSSVGMFVFYFVTLALTWHVVSRKTGKSYRICN